MSTKEEWRPIKGYEGYYEVSNLGRVRGVDRIINRIDGRTEKRKGKVMKLQTHRDGYLCVHLRKNGLNWGPQIHRLVATAFIPNPNNLPAVNHIDGNKQNNCVWNLEWCTYSENTQHAIKTGLYKIGINSPISKISQRQVKKIRDEYIPRSKSYGRKALAKKYGLSESTIHRAIHDYDLINE